MSHKRSSRNVHEVLARISTWGVRYPATILPPPPPAQGIFLADAFRPLLRFFANPPPAVARLDTLSISSRPGLAPFSMRNATTVWYRARSPRRALCGRRFGGIDIHTTLRRQRDGLEGRASRCSRSVESTPPAAHSRRGHQCGRGLGRRTCASFCVVGTVHEQRIGAVFHQDAHDTGSPKRAASITASSTQFSGRN